MEAEEEEVEVEEPAKKKKAGGGAPTAAAVALADACVTPLWPLLAPPCAPPPVAADVSRIL